MKNSLIYICVVSLCGCVGSTGGELLSFAAVARGEGPAGFTTPRGYEVKLTTAKLRVGALYLNETEPGTYATEQACVLPGIYSGEVRGGLEIDALSTVEQPFPVRGNGTSRPTAAAELWLTGGDIDSADDKTVVLEVAGIASKSGATFPFEGKLTIGKNRAIPPRDPALPGSNPLCRQRIVTPIPAALTLKNEGTVVVKVRPDAWFSNVEFAELPKVSDTPELYGFPDVTEGQPATALYTAVRSPKGAYTLELKP